jgi:hypothetical protein
LGSVAVSSIRSLDFGQRLHDGSGAGYPLTAFKHQNIAEQLNNNVLWLKATESWMDRELAECQFSDVRKGKRF